MHDSNLQSAVILSPGMQGLNFVYIDVVRLRVQSTYQVVYRPKVVISQTHEMKVPQLDIQMTATSSHC